MLDKHDKVIVTMMQELLKQMSADQDDSPGSGSMSEAMLNVFACQATMLYKYYQANPIEIVGALEVAKANILHSYYESLTRNPPT
ncbi:MAG: hypothetical protein QQN63_06210 [Nitrosopumilus sp.]